MNICVKSSSPSNRTVRCLSVSNRLHSPRTRACRVLYRNPYQVSIKWKAPWECFQMETRNYFSKCLCVWVIQLMSPWPLLLLHLLLLCRCGRTGPSPPLSCGCWSTRPSWRSRETQTTWVTMSNRASLRYVTAYHFLSESNGAHLKADMSRSSFLALNPDEIFLFKADAMSTQESEANDTICNQPGHTLDTAWKKIIIQKQKKELGGFYMWMLLSHSPSMHWHHLLTCLVGPNVVKLSGT